MGTRRARKDLVKTMRRRVAVGSLVAVGIPLVATALVYVTSRRAGVAAASLYLLGVVAASTLAGRWAGLGAAILSFLGLNYFFTPPRGTLTVRKAEDLVALVVFLLVAVVVGRLVSRALEERSRAERRESETRLLHRFTSSLLSERSLAGVLQDFAAAALDRFGLSRCAIELRGAPPVEASIAGGAEDAAEVRVAVASGETTLGHIVVVPRSGLTDDDRRLLGAVAGQLGLALERDRLDDEARRARTDAEVSRIRAALFSSVTHDLRTPLASIKAGATSLLDPTATHDQAQRQELLRTMLEETDRLNHLVTNLLNLARARAGGLALERELTPFEEVVEGVLGRMRGSFNGLDVRTSIRPDLPEVWVDPMQMDQAITNVLENAVRFSPPGGEIGIAVAPLEGGVQVRITDRGPGIREEDRERVFEPFYRGTDEASRRGTGLGLAIARAVVAAHDGTIEVKENPGGGTAVVIEVPPGAPQR